MTTDLATVPEALRPVEPIAAHMVASTDGTRLHVREWGRRDAQPIVFVHGWSQCDLCWAHQVRGALAERFHLITFDLRGHGRSDAPTEAGRYSDDLVWADDLAAVLEAVSARRPVLVALVVRRVRRRRLPACVRRGGDRRDRPRRGLHAPDTALRGHRAGTARERHGHVRRRPAREHRGHAPLPRRVYPAPADARRDGDRARLEHDRARGGPRSAARPGARCHGRVRRDRCVPMLVSHGRDDAIVLPAMAQELLERCPAATASWYDGVGHAPFWEAADRFDSELAALADRASRP